MSELFILIVAISCWIIGLRPTQAFAVDVRGLEFWLALSIFLFGGLGAVLPFFFQTSLGPDQTTILRVAPLVLMGLMVSIQTIRKRTPFVQPFAFALLLCFGVMLTGDGLVMPLISLLTFIPVLLVPAEGYDFNALRAGAISGITLFLLILGALLLLLPQHLLFACTGAYKCSIWGVKIGQMAWGNSLGIYLAAASAVSLLAASSAWYRFALVGAGSFICVEMTGSRSGLLGWAIAGTIALACGTARKVGSRVPVVVASIAACSLVGIVPLMRWSPSDLTFRPVLWRHSLELFGKSPVFGFGPSYWVRDVIGIRTGSSTARFALSTNYSTHNLMFELLVSAGLLGALAFVVALLLASSGARGDFVISIHEVALVGAFAGLSLTEVADAPGRVYLFPGLLVFIFLIASSSRGLSDYNSSGRSMENAITARLIEHRHLSRLSSGRADNVTHLHLPQQLPSGDADGGAAR